MKGIFVNENGCVPYARLIAGGYKRIETRGRDMLRPCVGQRVAIVQTRRGKKPMIIGFVDILDGKKCQGPDHWEAVRDDTLIPPGSLYDDPKRWLYALYNPEQCKPFPLPSSAIRHGRSWCEF